MFHIRHLDNFPSGNVQPYRSHFLLEEKKSSFNMAALAPVRVSPLIKVIILSSLVIKKPVFSYVDAFKSF